jgi:predicted nucleotide-binding protein
MTKKPISTAIGRPELLPARSIELLDRQIERGWELAAHKPVNATELDNWEHVTAAYIEKAFGSNSPNKSKFTEIETIFFFSDEPESWYEIKRAEKLQKKLRFLDSLIELLKTEIELQDDGKIVRATEIAGHKVFIVHGHNEVLLHEVEKFLSKLKLEVIILREQPNRGRTIIEKFEDLADAAYAIVLMTPDDRGGLRAEVTEVQKFRARQNVVLELGYFLGRLGRARVCALYRSDVEIPSDYSGVLYLPADVGGGWRLSLARELKAAGLHVDMSLAV